MLLSKFSQLACADTTYVRYHLSPIFEKFAESEDANQSKPKLSSIAKSPTGCIAMILAPPARNLRDFVRILYRDFPKDASRIVPLSIARNITNLIV
jgi:hypothetical protein